MLVGHNREYNLHINLNLAGIGEISLLVPEKYNLLGVSGQAITEA